MLRFNENELTSRQVIEHFILSSPNDWIAGEDEDEAAYRYRYDLLISLWPTDREGWYQLRYGYQTVCEVQWSII